MRVLEVDRLWSNLVVLPTAGGSPEVEPNKEVAGGVVDGVMPPVVPPGVGERLLLPLMPIAETSSTCW